MAHQKYRQFQSGRLWFFPAAIACLRLQELRRRSRGMGGSYTLSAVARMSPAEATKGYTIATVAALGQFASASPETRVRILGHVLEFAQSARAMDGLESLILSGIDASYTAGATAIAHRGMELWNRLARSSPSQRSNIVVFLSASQRVGFLGGGETKGLPHFAAQGMGEVNGSLDSVFSPGMPGGAMGRQIAGAVNGGIENMDGGDTCRNVAKYGTGVVGAIVGGTGGYVTGTIAGSSAGSPISSGIAGAALGVAGAVAGFGGGVALGKEIGSDVCGGSSTAPVDEGTYIGEVDDPNFLTGGDSTGTGTSSSAGSGDQGTYIGEVDSPNFVSGGTGSSGDSSGGSAGGGGSGSGSGDSGGSGGGSGGVDNPDTGAGEGQGGQQPGGLDNPEGDSPSGGYRPGRGPLGGMDNPETGVGEGPLPRGFLQGGYAVTTHTFLTAQAMQKAIEPITNALFSLKSLPLLGESSIGPILLRAGILQRAIVANLPPALSAQHLGVSGATD
jgi:hypothetical protein